VVHRHRRVRRLACETAPGADEKRAEHEHDVRIRETIVDEVQISKVAAVLAEWNPFGSRADRVPALDGHRIEAIDIMAFGVFRRSSRLNTRSAIF
jgi:hypothetical protein